MAIKTQDEIMEQLKDHFKDNTEDSVLTLLEDVADTLKAGADSTDWQKKFKESEAEWQKKVDEKDKEWRLKYQKRFFSSDDKDDKEIEEQDREVEEQNKAENITIDDLFVESKGE